MPAHPFDILRKQPGRQPHRVTVITVNHHINHTPPGYDPKITLATLATLATLPSLPPLARLPPRLAALEGLPEHYEVVPNDLDAVRAKVRALIAELKDKADA